MTTQETRRLQARILLLALAVLVLLGLIAASLTAHAYYQQARDRADLAQQAALQHHGQAVAQYFDRLEDIAWQVASRSRIRDELAAYNRGATDLEDLQDFSHDKLEDALRPSGAAGIIRLDAEGRQVLEVGDANPDPIYWPDIDPAMRETRMRDHLAWEGRAWIMIAVPILSREDEWLGADILVFPAEALVGVLESAAEGGKAAWLEGPQGVVLRVDDITWSLKPTGAGNLVAPALQQARGGSQALQRTDGEVVFAVPVRPGWGLSMAVPEEELYAGMMAHLALPVGLVLGMALLSGLGLIGVIRPLSRQVVAQSEALERASEEQEDLLEYASGFVYRFDRSGRARYISPGVERVLGRSMDRLPETTLRALVEPFLPYLEGTAVPIDGGTDSELPPARAEVTDKAGNPVVLELNARVRYNSGHVVDIFGVARDVTSREEARRRVSHLANYDPLTDLPNRTQLDERLARAIERCRLHDERLAVLFVDLDGFKYVNDSLGHHRGDELLEAVARRLLGAIDRHSTIARHGGDEFVVLTEHIAGTDDAERVADNLLRALEAPFHVAGQELFIGASIGISLFPDDAASSDMLIRNADSAMYRAKARGRNNVQLYTADLTDASQRRLAIEAGLRRAIEGNELEVVYQPQWYLPGEGLSGAEALVRWRHPDFGMISPAEFIPVAEENGTIGLLGRWVLREAVRRTCEWGPQRLGRIGVNVSGHQVLFGDIAGDVRAVLEETGLEPWRLELEITEGFVMDHAERGIAVLEELRAMGVQLAIDDFGTGYSSLSYLKRLPVQRLKVDASFVQGADTDAADAALTASIIAMGHKLGLTVIAEGVETATQRDMIILDGCDEAQGYYLARPMSTEQMGALIEDPVPACRRD